ncbi:MAG: hypothetical protein JXA30_22975 [Deltaproteobacteria bacterium]|nr:hypothetical protein [Deltaproteobacteria bacterium]
MANPIQALITEFKRQLPGAVATAVFSIGDGLMLAVDSDVPDTNIDAMSAIHANIWDRINNFLKILPEEICGGLHSMILEVEGASFFIVVDAQLQVALMAGVNATGNLGMLRVMSNKYLTKLKPLIG